MAWIAKSFRDHQIKVLKTPSTECSIKHFIFISTLHWMSGMFIVASARSWGMNPAKTTILCVKYTQSAFIKHFLDAQRAPEAPESSRGSSPRFVLCAGASQGFSVDFYRKKGRARHLLSWIIYLQPRTIKKCKCWKF